MVTSTEEKTSLNPRQNRSRFAPSPTGELHWGSLFNALASYLQARSQQGEWLLRIDDLDPARSHQRFIDSILYTLERFGLQWDGGVYYQSQHTEHYQAAVDVLCKNNQTYACRCSRKQLKRYHNQHPETPDYPGFCRNKTIDTRSQYALRVKTNRIPVVFSDPLQGTQQQILAQTSGDFIIMRSDKITGYHLASVVDDFNMGINQALRGYDLLQSSIQQCYLQQLLGYPTPQYVHLPVIVDTGAIKLSKQTGAKPITHNPVVETLFYLLIQLRQKPPPELRHLPRKTIIDWAVANWNIDRLKGCTKIKHQNQE
ncbi:MAG TPA: tRNA glutamyl-Q(34) synthetase GluQRS [Crenotrichaceae bacterium]|nr:tRNA glutamyl-Q(34) synthetase GluQRS [Crenotrichaceae bacterium]